MVDQRTLGPLKNPRSAARKPRSAAQWFKVEVLITTSTVLSLLLAWHLVTHFNLVTDVLLPTPGKVWSTFVRLCVEGYKDYSLLQHLGHSLWRLLAAFLLVILTAIPLGLLSGFSSKVSAVIDPIVEFTRPLPPLAYYTLLVLWLGIENNSKIALLYLAGFAPVYIACVAGVKRVKGDWIQCARTLGASRRQLFFHVIFPACLPDIFTGLRTAVGVIYATLVAAEMVAAITGIGWMVLDASKYLRSDVIIVGIIIMGITGLLLDRMIRIIEDQAIPWKGKHR